MPRVIEVPAWLVVTIPAVLVTAALSFVAGVRYCGRNMLPGIMARKTDEELDQLADQVAAEREGSEAA